MLNLQLKSPANSILELYPFPVQLNNLPLPFLRLEYPSYQITCVDPDSPGADPVPKLMLSGQLYHVKDIFPDVSDEGTGNLVTLVNDDLIRDFNGGSCRSLRNLTITVSAFPPNQSLSLPLWTINLTFFKCPSPSRLPPPPGFLDRVAFNSTYDDEQYRFYLWRNDSAGSQRGQIVRSFDNFMTTRDCDLVMVPVSSVDVNNITIGYGGIQSSQLIEALATGFPLQWNSLEDCRNYDRRNERCGFVDGQRNQPHHRHRGLSNDHSCIRGGCCGGGNRNGVLVLLLCFVIA